MEPSPEIHVSFQGQTPFDPKGLAQLTEQALCLLELWYNYDKKGPLSKAPVQSISKQARDCIIVIENGIKLAQIGHDVAENALRLTQVVDRNIQNSKEEYDKFAMNMLHYVNQTLQRTRESLEKFQTISQTLNRDYRALCKKHTSYRRLRRILFLADIDKIEKDGIQIFQKMIECLQGYTTWWTMINLLASSQKDRYQRLESKKKFSRIGDAMATRRWAELADTFLQYTLEINTVWDGHPELFSKIPKERANATEARSGASHVGGTVKAALNNISTKFMTWRNRLMMGEDSAEKRNIDNLHPQAVAKKGDSHHITRHAAYTGNEITTAQEQYPDSESFTGSKFGTSSETQLHTTDDEEEEDDGSEEEEDDDHSLSLMTMSYSNAHSSVVTEYGTTIHYTRRAVNSSHSLLTQETRSNG